MKSGFKNRVQFIPGVLAFLKIQTEISEIE
jgi:hypothetical protein